MSSAARDVALVRARARADLARMRFINECDGLIGHFTPDNLKSEAMEFATEQFDQAKKSLLARLRHWPFVLGAALSGLLLILLWKPALGVAQQTVRILGIFMPLLQLWRQSHD